MSGALVRRTERHQAVDEFVAAHLLYVDACIYAAHRVPHDVDTRVVPVVRLLDLRAHEFCVLLGRTDRQTGHAALVDEPYHIGNEARLLGVFSELLPPRRVPRVEESVNEDYGLHGLYTEWV